MALNILRIALTAVIIVTTLPANGLAQYEYLLKTWEEFESESVDSIRNRSVKTSPENSYRNQPLTTPKNLSLSQSLASPGKGEVNPFQWEEDLNDKKSGIRKPIFQAPIGKPLDGIKLPSLNQKPRKENPNSSSLIHHEGGVLLKQGNGRAVVLPEDTDRDTAPNNTTLRVKALRWIKDVFGGTNSGYDYANRESFQKVVVKETQRYRLDPAFVAALIRAESNYDPNAISPKNARGLMQLMPSTARQLLSESGVTMSKRKLFRILHDPESNIRLGTLLLAQLFEVFQGVREPVRRQTLVLAAYNAGVKRVEKIFNCRAQTCHRRINSLSDRKFAGHLRQLPSETRTYIAKVQRFHRQHKTKHSRLSFSWTSLHLHLASKWYTSLAIVRSALFDPTPGRALPPNRQSAVILAIS